MNRLLATSLLICSIGGIVGCSDSNRSAPASATAVPARPVEEFKEITVPAGTTLSVALDEGVGSATSRVDEPVRAHLTRPVSIDGVVVAPVNSEVSGAVVEAVRSARVKGRARVAIRFDSLRLPDGGDTYPIRTPAIAREARGTMKKDAMKIGIPAAAGAVLGGIFGGGKGAAIGAGVGGGAGAGVVMSTRGEEITLGRGAVLSVKLLDAIAVRARIAPVPVTTAVN